MSSAKVAVVTGSNKGIGFAIVRGLCKEFKGDVYLTSRDDSRGKAAVKELEKEGLHPKFHQLDVDDKQSIENLKKSLLDKYGGLDLLVNNAGILYKADSKAPISEQAEMTVKTNYWSTLHVSEILFPLLRSHARVVHLSSMASVMCLEKCSAELQAKVKSVRNFTELNTLMTQFVDDAKAGVYEKLGWLHWYYYGFSKIGVSIMARIQQEQLNQDTTRRDIVVNACCPGYVKTDMTSHLGHKSIDEGADTPLYLALLPEGTTSPRGDFVFDRKIQEF